MPPKISRRELLKEGAKAAAAVTAVGALVGGAAEARQGRGARRAGGEARGAAAASARLDEYVRAHMREAGAPGLTLAVADARGLVRASAYGFADTKARVPVRPDTLFQIGSISKSLAAVLLLRLRDENRLDFGRPVKEYLPWLDLRENHGPVTTHHLLTHTAGLQAAPLIPQSLAGPVETYAAPGERFVYSNIGYLILGLVVEAADRRPFADSLRERVLRPLGMNASTPVITNGARPRMAVGYGPLYDDRPRRARGPLAEAPWVDVDTAAGSVASTPADMAAYIRMLLGRGRTPTGQILSREGFELLTEPAIKAPFRGEEAEYARGLWVSRDPEGHTRLRHTGGMVAFSSSLDVDATAGLGAFASVNASLAGGYRPVAVTKYAVELMRAARAGRALPDPPAPPPDPLEVKNATDYAGVYASPGGKTLRVVAEGARLFLWHAGRRVALERSGGRDSFVAHHPDFELYRLVFGREGDRVVEAGHGPDWYAGEGYAGPRAFEYPREWDAFGGLYRNDSPWYGPARVVLRKGRLWLDGEEQLFPLGGHLFSVGPPERSYERMSFDALKGGRALRMNFSTVEFYRTLL